MNIKLILVTACLPLALHAATTPPWREILGRSQGKIRQLKDTLRGP